MHPEVPRLNDDVIREPFHNLLAATGNKLDREWKDSYSTHRGSRVMLRALVLSSDNTYRTVRHFCAEHPKDPARKPEYALSAPPLARSILDALFTVVFAFENLAERTEWYYKAGWREIHEEHARHLSRYGADDGWKEYLAEQTEFLDKTRVQWGITAPEAANPSKAIKRWPIPSQMAKHKGTSQERRDFMSHLEDWFYRELSQDAHLSWPGLARRSAYLMLDRDERDDEAKWKLAKKKSDAFFTCVVLLLAMMSEIECELRFGLDERLKYVWGICNAYFEAGKEVYDMRYAGRL